MAFRNSKLLIKQHIKNLKKDVDRKNSGKITIRYKESGANKKKYRKINFYRIGVSVGITYSIEYDSNRNASIAAIYDFFNYNFFYILAPKNLSIGDIVKLRLTAVQIKRLNKKVNKKKIKDQPYMVQRWIQLIIRMMVRKVKSLVVIKLFEESETINS